MRVLDRLDTAAQVMSDLGETLVQNDCEAFRALWAAHEVPTGESIRKRLVHPRVGTIEIDCQTLVAETEGQLLLVYTATPGTESAEKLRLIGVLGTQEFGASTTNARGAAATA
jgi:hypothetical protein